MPSDNEEIQSIDIIDEDNPASKTSDSVKKAVAIGYDREVDDAPKLLASGKGAVAEQIMSLAFAHGIKVRKDTDLVEILSTIEVEETIPLEAFTAVAEILSYVYRANAIYGKNAATTDKKDIKN